MSYTAIIRKFLEEDKHLNRAYTNEDAAYEDILSRHRTKNCAANLCTKEYIELLDTLKEKYDFSHGMKGQITAIKLKQTEDEDKAFVKLVKLLRHKGFSITYNNQDLIVDVTKERNS